MGAATANIGPSPPQYQFSSFRSFCCIILILRSLRSKRLEGCRPVCGLMVRDALRAPHHEGL